MAFVQLGDASPYPGESAPIFRVTEGNPPRVGQVTGLATDRGECANRVARTVGVEVSASRKFEAPPISHWLLLAAVATTVTAARGAFPRADDLFEPSRHHG